MEALTNEFRVPWPAGVPFPSREEKFEFGAHHFAVLIGTIERDTKRVQATAEAAREAVFLMLERPVLASRETRRVVGVVDGIHVLDCVCGCPAPPEVWSEPLRVEVRAKCVSCATATAYYAHKRQALQAWNAGNFERVKN